MKKRILTLLIIVMCFGLLASCTIKIGDIVIGSDNEDEKVEYTVDFVTNCDTEIKSIKVEEGKGFVINEDLVKDGYTFEGWYKDEACTEIYYFLSAVNNDLTLYAKWLPVEGGKEERTYTITYVTNGEETILPQTYGADEITTPPVEPAKSGYTFDGWYLDSSFTNKFSFGSKLTDDITLYAKWSLKVVYSSDATLSALTINGISVPNFNANTTSYSVTITAGLSSFVVSATTTNVNATIKSGLGSYDVESGNVVNVTVKVQAQDGTLKEYNIVVTSPVESEGESFIYYAGLNEALCATFIDSNPENAIAYYRLSGTTKYTQVDEELVRSVDGVGRVDILGIKPGLYDIKVIKSDATVLAVDGINVCAQDRSGYAHFDNSANAIGAYNDDGSLKSNAIVIYVTNATKNTISYGGYTGLVKILSNIDKLNAPVCIRILDSIKTNQFNAKSDAPRLADNSNYTTSSELTAFYTNTLETTYGENLVGIISKVTIQGKYNVTYTATLTSQTMKTSSRSSSATTTYSRTDYSDITGKTVYDDDSYFNMIDITSTKGLTIEGVGTNAEIFQWGMTFSKSKNVEVKNITFTSQPEDACSFNGSSNSDLNYFGFWLHNCTFNRGVNNWDVTGERDKYAGDGASDLRYCHGVTLSYNLFNNTNKTGLVGGSDSNYQYNISFHHNYYNNVASRLPLGRQANMHIYNNYYYKCSSTLSIRANAYVFLEGNYFDQSKYPQTTKSEINSFYPQIKGYNNIFSNCKGDNYVQTVSNRENSIEGVNCSINGVSYVGFDTNSELFYYDSTKKVTKVTVLTSPEQAKADCIAYAGVLKNNQTIGILG